MKRLKILAPGAAALLLTGCVYSLNPLYTPADLATDPALVGTWVRNGSDSWKFEPGDGSSYKLTVTENEVSSPFTAHLLQFGGHRFLDIYPDKSAIEQLKLVELYKGGLIGGHLFIKIVNSKPDLQLAVLNDEWLGNVLKKDPSALAWQKREGGEILLTASTKALQEFVTRHWNTPGAWGEKVETLKRK